MRCLVCEAWSLNHICKRCQATLLRPTPKKRHIIEDFYVYSFYGYSEIEELLLTKHSYIGAYIYRILAKNSFESFKAHLNLAAFVIPVDDRIKKDGYSHTAILAKALKSKGLKPRYNTLWASNEVSYAGKSLEYRLTHPRGLIYKGPAGEIVIVDDIVTTGLTLKEAYYATKAKGASPIAALVLADARD